MHTAPIIALENISFAYAGQKALFDGLDFRLRPGDQLGLYGSNGCGKSTLLRLIMGLEKPGAGTLRFHGKPLSHEKQFHELRCRVGLILQDADDQLFSPTVLEEVAFGPLNLGLGKDEARERAKTVLADLDMAGFADRLTHRLSGGEKKLVSIASVLAMRPEALLLDEPTAFLDDKSRDRIVEILTGPPDTRIVVSHDRFFLERTASAYMSIRQGRLTAPEQALPLPR